MRRLLTLTLTVTLWVPSPVSSQPVSPAFVQQPAAAVHTPPVAAPILDRFRPPPSDQPWRPGNRGIEYDTVPGQTVAASAVGTVTFAGRIGAHRYVTVHHSPDLRTTYSFLATIAAQRGDRVQRGETIGTAGETFHFGALFADVYIDPELLFEAQPVRRTRLVD